MPDVKVKQGSIPVFVKRSSSSSSTTPHSLDRFNNNLANNNINNNGVINNNNNSVSNVTNSGLPKARESSLPRSVTMSTTTTGAKKTDLADTMARQQQILQHHQQLLQQQFMQQQQQLTQQTTPAKNVSQGSRLPSFKSSDKSKLARPKTSVSSKLKKEGAPTESATKFKSPTPSVQSSCDHNIMTSTISSSSSMLSSASSSSSTKLICSPATTLNRLEYKKMAEDQRNVQQQQQQQTKLSVEALNKKNTFMSSDQQTVSNNCQDGNSFNINNGNNSAYYETNTTASKNHIHESKLMKPTSTKPSGLVKPRQISKPAFQNHNSNGNLLTTTTMLNDSTVNRSMEDVLSDKQSGKSQPYFSKTPINNTSAKKRFGSAEGILSPSFSSSSPSSVAGTNSSSRDCKTTNAMKALLLDAENNFQFNDYRKSNKSNDSLSVCNNLNIINRSCNDNSDKINRGYSNNDEINFNNDGNFNEDNKRYNSYIKKVSNFGFKAPKSLNNNTDSTSDEKSDLKKEANMNDKNKINDDDNKLNSKNSKPAVRGSISNISVTSSSSSGSGGGADNMVSNDGTAGTSGCGRPRVPRYTSQLPKSKLPSTSTGVHAPPSSSPALIQKKFMKRVEGKSADAAVLTSASSCTPHPQTYATTDNTDDNPWFVDNSYAADILKVNKNFSSSPRDGSNDNRLKNSSSTNHEICESRSNDINVKVGDDVNFDKSDNTAMSAFDIKPMAPIAMSSPYFHLNSLSSFNNNSHYQAQPPCKSFRPTASKLQYLHADHSNNDSAANSPLKLFSNNNPSANRQELCENEGGYMSDGDLLSYQGHQRSSGYVSDGGTSLQSYMSKFNADDQKNKTLLDESLFDDQMDGGSSLSSNEDQPVNPSSTTSAAKAQMMLEKNKFLKDLSENNFSRASGNRSTMPVRGRRAILPLSGFVKKTQENESNSIPDLEETEIDVEVMFQEKISNIQTCNKNNIDSISTKSNGSGKSNHQTKLINLMTSSDKDGKSIINLNNSITKPSMVNEGMIELDEVLSLPTEGNMRKGSIKSVGSNAKISSANMPSSLFSNLNNNEEYLPPSLVAPTLSSLSSHPSSYSLLSHQSLNDAKATSSVMTTTSSSLFAGKKDGLSSGSKFGMSLEQCYNSGVFQRRNQSGDDGDSINNRSFKLGKTLSIVSDGDQQTAAPLTPFSCQNVVSPFKVNPYATMSRSQIASRMARKLEENVNPQNADTVSCNILSPLPNRRSDTSLYHNNDDASSLASFPSFKLQSINNYPSSPQPSCFKTSSGTPGLVVQPQLNMTDGVDRRMRTSSSGYMLNRSGSHSNYGGGSVSRPQSTNGNGSTLSLGSCSSLYSTAEEYHAQEIRKLRHELETAHSRVASLNMQLNINESVVQAFEQSIQSLNQRLQQLTNMASDKDSDVKDLKTSLDRFSAHSSIPEDVTSLSSINQHQEMERKKKQKKWLTSFGKSFFKRKNKLNQMESNNLSLHDNNSIHSSSSNILVNHMNIHNNELIIPDNISNISFNNNQSCDPDDPMISLLEQKLHEKEMKLTDVQLEALTSAHQLDQLKDNMAQMEKEMAYLKMDNSRLKQLVSKTADNKLDDPQQQTSPTALNSNKIIESPTNPSPRSVHKAIVLSVRFAHVDHLAPSSPSSEAKSTEILFGKMHLTENMGWETLNKTILRKFHNYLVRIDPEEHLGLDQTSIQHLHIGDLKWTIDGPSPPMSPSSYLIGYNDSVSLTLKGVDENRLDSLSFETMISRSILERYVSLMTEFKRVIFCGPSGTGKTYLALKLAQYMSDRLAKEGRQPKMSLFNVDHKSSKELRQYLSGIAQDSTAAAAAATAENGNSDNAFQNNVIILDNLHHVVSVADVFNGFISMGNQNSPYVIGTMNQVSSSSASTNLQLHHMFRWVLYSNHIKPVHGFLGRFLRRHLVEREVLESNVNIQNKNLMNSDSTSASISSSGADKNVFDAEVDDEEELKKMIDWIPQVWQHVNRLLEMHNSSEVTLGPQLYLSCPMASQLIKLWFTDLWNYSIFPYIVEAIKEGIQTYGCRAVWEDPTDWIVRTCPWSSEASTQFLHLRPEDVGYDMTQQQHSLVTSSNNNASNNSINNNTGSAAFHNNINNNLYINNCADDGSHSAKISNTDPLLKMLLKLQEVTNNNANNVTTKAET